MLAGGIVLCISLLGPIAVPTTEIHEDRIVACLSYGDLVLLLGISSLLLRGSAVRGPVL